MSGKSSTAAKANKKAKAANSVLDKILMAIRSQTATSENGISRTSIVKYLKVEFQYENAPAIKRTLQKAVSSKTLFQTGQSFRVAGDPLPQVAATPKVVMKDIKEGTGPEAKTGDTVIVKYEGKLNCGTVFDSASSFDFVLGAGDVIKGWDQGIAGMKVGGKRKLEVPSRLGYGKRGAPPEIPPNADLFFTVTLKKIQ